MTTFPKGPRPVTQPTPSYWLSQADPALANFCSSDRLPEFVDTVIIGSGFTAAVIAHELQARSKDKKPDVLVLEARDIASGATGRNGGHIKPDCYKNFSDYLRRYDESSAKSLSSFEMLNMRETVRFIKEQGLAEEIDLVETRSVDVFMTEESWEHAVESYHGFDRAGGDVSAISLHDSVEAREKFRVNGIFGAVSYPACSLWPFKLASGLIRRSIEAGVQVFSNTLVTRIDRSPANSSHWQLMTSRGLVTCAKVFHATNAYAASVLPAFHRIIVPVKGHVAAIEPVEPYRSRPLQETYGIQWGEDFDYLIQRPTDGKPLIYGGRDLAHKAKLPGVIGDSDDSQMTPEIVAALRSFPFQYFSNWNQLPDVRVAWSGIMGFTADGFPFLGEVPGMPGQYIAAGFNGHGMARLFLSARAVVQIAHGEQVDARVPPQYYDIAPRLSRVSPEWEELLAQAAEASGYIEFKARI